MFLLCPSENLVDWYYVILECKDLYSILYNRYMMRPDLMR